MRNLLLTFLGLAIACHATAVMTVTFSPMIVTGAPGQTVGVFGTLTNNAGTTQFINSDTFNLTGISGGNDSLFLIDAPISLGPGATSASFEFMNEAIPMAQALGLYNGAFTVIGGADGNAQDNLGTGSFSINVVPEPSSALLFGGAFLAVWVRRRLYPR